MACREPLDLFAAVTWVLDALGVAGVPRKVPPLALDARDCGSPTLLILPRAVLPSL
jgi:hypothetical protein